MHLLVSKCQLLQALPANFGARYLSLDEEFRCGLGFQTAEFELGPHDLDPNLIQGSKFESARYEVNGPSVRPFRILNSNFIERSESSPNPDPTFNSLNSICGSSSEMGVMRLMREELPGWPSS